MKKILLLLILFFSVLMTACTDNNDEEKTFKEQLQDYVTAFEIERTDQNYDFYKIPSLEFPYRDTMTPSSMKSALIEDYNATRNATLSNIPYLLKEVLQVEELVVVENEPTQVDRIYNDITTKQYTITYQVTDDGFDIQIYTERMFNDDRDFFHREELHVLLYIFECQNHHQLLDK